MTDNIPEVWVKAESRLPEVGTCCFIRWLDEDDGHVVSTGSSIFGFYHSDKFDVSDDDDEEPETPRTRQPDEWFDEQALTALQSEVLALRKAINAVLEGEEYSLNGRTIDALTEALNQ